MPCLIILNIILSDLQFQSSFLIIWVFMLMSSCHMHNCINFICLVILPYQHFSFGSSVVLSWFTLFFSSILDSQNNVAGEGLRPRWDVHYPHALQPLLLQLIYIMPMKDAAYMHLKGYRWSWLLDIMPIKVEADMCLWKMKQTCINMHYYTGYFWT